MLPILPIIKAKKTPKKLKPKTGDFKKGKAVICFASFPQKNNLNNL
jgi:hypothetical protein